MNNKGIVATSLSLACHTVFLFLALNLALTPPPQPVEPPILIHVHLEARPFSPSMGNHGQKIPEKNTTMKAPEMKMQRLHPTQQNSPQPATAVNMPTPRHKPIASTENVVTVVRKNIPAKRAPSQPKTYPTVYSAKQVFKDMAVSHRELSTASIMPVSDISNQMQQIMKPSLESQVQNYQGETPYLPFDQNGSGTDIKSFLGYDLYTYEDPDDHVKYFRLSIKVEDIPGSLEPLPKEITFLVDGSNSIGNPVFDQFKIAIADCLDELGANDRFNIMVFNDTLNKMQGTSVSNTPDNVHEGKEYINGFRVGSDTDLYKTVLQSIDTPHTIKPSYILLISDGEPTAGITDSLQLINKIGQVNGGRVPIFSLGVGWANEYLMNFLSFTNHGWAEFVPLNTANSIRQLYDHIKDPVLLNLRYNSIGLDRKEIYPKLLPDLFKGSEFVLYGKFTTEGDFLFQLRGNSKTDIKQYIIKDNLNNGHPGDRSIAQEWAMRKIYDLIGQLQYDQSNQAIIDAINQLAVKFDLKIPQYQIGK